MGRCGKTSFNLLILSAFFACLLLLSPPVLAQCPADMVDDGNYIFDDVDDYECGVDPPIPYDICDHEHLSGIVRAAIAEAISQLTAEGYDITTDNNGPNNCPVGYIVERAVEIMKNNGNGEGAGLIYKPTGNGCNEHSVDIIMFPNGCIYDAIVGVGESNTPGFELVCCGPKIAEGGDGTCSGRYLPP